MGTVSKILVWWVLFGGAHFIGSSVPIRSRLIAAIGLWPFKALYSIVALATFVQLVRVYFADKHAGPLLYAPAGWLRAVAQVLMFPAVVLLVQGLVTPGPTTTAGEAMRKGAEPRGILRITRHPQNLAYALFGAAHCLVNPAAGDWLFFGGFVVFAVLSAIHQDRRTAAAGSEAAREFLARTSLVPFGAILKRRQRLVPGEFSVAALVVSAILFVALRLYHGAIFGGFAN
ncbi:MAG: NnrU family protein [Acidobacteriota bacterium]